MIDLVARIRRHVVEVGDCWEWQGAVQHNSPVPTLNWQGSTKPVRRHIAEARGDQVEDRVATYKCGNELCVNPDHVIVVTRRRVQKRTAQQGKQSNQLRKKKLADRARERSKLSIAIVAEIRGADLPQRQLAALYGVSQATISVIKRGMTWRDYSNPFTALIKGKK